MNTAWKDGELGYCLDLVCNKGDANVGHYPEIIIRYLRLQASSAFRDGEYEISARLGEAAQALNTTLSINDQLDDYFGPWSYAWKRAIKALDHNGTRFAG